MDDAAHPMTRTRSHPRRRGFTLLELILVMLILAIVSGAVVPRLMSFAAGRRAGYVAMRVVGLATYARAQAVSEGVPYRLNFDPAANAVWLTRGAAGVFEPAPGEYGEHVTFPAEVKMTVQVTPAAISIATARDDQPQLTEATPAPFGGDVAEPNALVRVPHAAAMPYVEVSAGGRTDPCVIRLTDDGGGATITVGVASAADQMHVLTAGEL